MITTHTLIMILKYLTIFSVFTFNLAYPCFGQDPSDKGPVFFTKMTQTLNPTGKKITTVIFIGKNTVYSSRAPGGKVEMHTRKAYNFKEQSRHTEFKSPAGPVTIFLENNSGAKIVKGRRTPLRDYEEEQLKNGLNFHYLNVTANSENFRPEYMGTHELKDELFHKLVFNIDGQDVSYFLQMETFYPVYVQFRQYSEEFEETVTVTEHYFDWEKVKDIAVAFKKTTLEKDKTAGSFEYSSIKFN